MEKDLISEIVHKHFPIYEEFAGETATNIIIDNAISNQPLENIIEKVEDQGSPFDLEQTLKILSLSISIIKAIIDIVNTYATKHEANLNKKSIEKKINTKYSINEDTIDEQKIEKIIDDVIIYRFKI